MRPPRSVSPPARGLRSVAAAAIAAGAILASLLVATPATAAVQDVSTPSVTSGLVKAAAVVGFNPENIISDALFYDGAAMTAAEIQAFLDAKIGTCRNGKCLNVISITSDSKRAYYSQTTGKLVCDTLTGGTMRASEFIYRVQAACGISAKVILVTMQKERSLTTATAPTDTDLRKAMGHLCSDSAPCETSAAGIANQIFGGAEQLKKYKATAFGKQPGNNWIGYHPNAKLNCGGSTLNIRNYATAALYNYTPYQPNAAAIAAGIGAGDICSSYGNRNFYNFYTAWFGSTQAAVDPCKAPAASAITPASGEYTTTAALNGRAAPNTSCTNILTTFPKGTIVTRVGTLDKWWSVRVDGVTYWVHSDYLTATPAVAYKTDRIQGATRYETAVAVSEQVPTTSGGTVYLASGQNFPDSVAGSAAAAYTSSALLLTTPTELPTATANRLLAAAPKRVVILGGPQSVSDSVLSAVKSLFGSGVKVERIAGDDRYATSRTIVSQTWKTSPKVYIATGMDFPDALSAASAAASQDAPVILVDGRASSLPADTVATIRTLGATSAVIAGGPQAVSEGIATQLRSLGLAVDRKNGVDRFQTSVLLAQSTHPTTAARVFMASGIDFPDALSGSVLSGSLGAPLLLERNNCMVAASKDFVLSRAATRVTLFGGEAALTAGVATGVRC